MTVVSPEQDTVRPNLAELAAQVAGPVLTPADPGFAAEIMGFNVANVPSPDLAVGATDAEDVAAAVRWAAANGLTVTVQSTGHGSITSMAGGLLVNTRRMTDVVIDPVAGTATVGAGTRWSQVITAAAPHGLAPLNGSSSQVGVVGYSLGGGLGPLGRRYGFAADHIRSLQLVTAYGEIREVTAGNDPDLFWAIRGGKGNFGIVTALEFSLVPVARLYGGGIFFPVAAAPDVLTRWREWSTNLSEESSTSVALLQLPPDPALPEPLRGQRVVHLRFVHLGSADEGAAVLAPMRAVAAALLDGVSEIPYAAIDSVHMDPVVPMPSLERGVALRELPLEAIDAVLAQVGADVMTPLVVVEIRQLGGALARQPAVPNAVAGRDSAFTLFAVGVLAGPVADLVPDALQSLMDTAQPWSSGSLLNFQGPAAPAQVGALWNDADRARLLAVKNRLDPAGLFRPTQIIG
jgi:FAD/FMN-containing dehydrogenase